MSPWVPAATAPIAVRIPLAQLTEIPRRIHGLCMTARWPAHLIRNFCIVAHVDHGKTTLSDAILRRGGALDDSRPTGTYTDKLTVERERGITIKSQACTFFIKHPQSTTGEVVMMNLIDTPGHVDFAGEVSRSLRATEGAVLLVDAAQGVQAQTIACMYLALENENAIVPALSKLDVVMNESQILSSMQELESSTGLTSAEVVMTAAKAKRGVEALLGEIVRRVPPPRDADPAKPLRGLVVDSWVVAPQASMASAAAASSRASSSEAAPRERLYMLSRLMEGSVKKGDVIATLSGRARYGVVEVGLMYPDLVPVGDLIAGQVGYVELVPLGPLHAGGGGDDSGNSSGSASPAAATTAPSTAGTSSDATATTGAAAATRVLTGDTFCLAPKPGPTAAAELAAVKPVCAVKPVRPVVFASFFPDEGATFESLQQAVERLLVNDPAVTCALIRDGGAFGRGLQLGFLGSLHMSVFQQRLESEHACNALVTPAQVFYRYIDRATGREMELTTQTWVSPHEGAESYLEPVVTCTIVAPTENVAELVTRATADYRGEIIDMTALDQGRPRSTLRLRMPLADLSRGWASDVKSITRGFADLELSEPSYVPADLVKVDFVVNKAPIGALATICVRSQAQALGRQVVTALKENLERASVDLPIQAFIGAKCIARETLSGFRADVTSKCHAGDPSRRRKKLDHQKRGKARLARRMVGQVSIDEDTLIAVVGASRVGST